MYNLNEKILKLYDEKIRIKEARDKLLAFKDTNIERIKKGLSDERCAQPIKTLIQGSVSMHTTNKAEGNDYDIDIGIIFKKEEISNNPKKAKELILKSLKKSNIKFRKEPKVGKNAVTVFYASGEHVDFAVYRKYIKNGIEYYEHAGKEWGERDPKAITDWFIGKTSENPQIRRIVRYLKFNTKANLDYKMPGGLIITTLVVECYEKNERDDVSLYKTLLNISNRLDKSKIVKNPTNKNLTLMNPGDVEINNFKNHLSFLLSKLNVLNKLSCNEDEALEAWNYFFDNKLNESHNKNNIGYLDLSILDIKKEDVEYYKENNNFGRNVIKEKSISEMIRLPKDLVLFFELNLNKNIPKPKKIEWEINNNGFEAKKANDLNSGPLSLNSETFWTSTAYSGNHFLICRVELSNGNEHTIKRNVKIR